MCRPFDETVKIDMQVTVRLIVLKVKNVQTRPVLPRWTGHESWERSFRRTAHAFGRSLNNRLQGLLVGVNAPLLNPVRFI